MSMHYLLTNEAQEKIAKGDLAPRLKDLKRRHSRYEDGVPDVLSFVSRSDIYDMTQQMKER